MNAARSKPLRIAVLGHFHGRNLGDDLVVSTLLDAIRLRMPDAEILGISLAPADTRERHGIPSYPLNPGLSQVAPSLPREVETVEVKRMQALRRLRRRIWSVQHATAMSLREVPFLLQSYRLLGDVDLIVVAGSGPLEDTWGPWRHGYTIFRWSLLARMRRVRMLFLSVGAGPIDRRLSAFFFRRSLGWAEHVTVRDESSGRVLAARGIPGERGVVPDMAFGLPERYGTGERRPAPAPGRGAVVGLNIMAHQDPRYSGGADRPRYHVYLQTMATLAELLLDAGHTVRLFSSQTIADSLAIDDLVRLLDADGRSAEPKLERALEQIHTVEDLIGVIESCDVIVAARFHCVVVPLLFGVPVLGLAYHAKTGDVLAAAGQAENAFDIDTVDASTLFTTVLRMLDPIAPEARAERHAALARQRAAVEEQFDAVFGRPDAHSPVAEIGNTGPAERVVT